VYHPEIGDLTGIKDRAQRRLFQVGDVRMPGTPEIAAVILGLFSDIDDLRVVGHSADKLVDVQAAKAAAEPGPRHQRPRRNPRLRRPLRGQRAAGTLFRHMVSNIAVTISGNRAAASAYLLVLISKDGNHRSLPPGRYACELIKEDTGQ
jgi:hypothetical protein